MSNILFVLTVEFQNLNSSITLESNQTVGEAVFTLTINGEDTLSPDITLRTESVYFELDPTDNSKCLFFRISRYAFFPTFYGILLVNKNTSWIVTYKRSNNPSY